MGSRKSLFGNLVDKSKEKQKSIGEDKLHQNTTISSLNKPKRPRSRTNVLDKVAKNRVEITSESSHYLDNIDPIECQIWHRQSRFFDLLDEKQCEDLISDFKGHIGQKIPITIREIPVGVKKNNDKIKYEVVAGSRRLWSALYVQKQFKSKFKLKAILKKLDDKQSAVECEKENEREELSAFEKGMFYYNLLAQNIFSNQKQLSDSLNIPTSSLQDLLEFGRMNKKIVEVFSDPREIKRSWVKCLNQLDTNKVSQKAMLSKIVEIESSTLKYTDQKIYNILKNVGTKAVEIPSSNKFNEIRKEIKDPKTKKIAIKMERTRTNKIRISIENKITMSKKDILKNMEDFLLQCEK
jgi:ParB/RepB/Spo0J family partition protein